MPFERRHGELHADDVALTRIADAVGTPAYVYSWTDVHDCYQALETALEGIDHRICYAVKANSNLSILARLARLGAGFDIVSGGELERVLRAGGDPRRVVFSGVGKCDAEIDFGIKCGIGTFNVESAAELERIEARSRIFGRPAPVSVRVNPDVDANTHPYISTGLKENKFGVPAPIARELYRRAHASPTLDVVGIDCHIGSQVADVDPFRDALATLIDLVDALAAEGITCKHIDIGGGFGVTYRDEKCLDVAQFGQVAKAGLGDRALKLFVEPGRYLVAEAGVLLTRVEYLKPATAPGMRNFAVVDAAMNDLIRPPLYGAWHDVQPVVRHHVTPKRWDVVGSVCETADFIARDRYLALEPGGLLAVRTAGAYGFVQSSNYNTRARPPEVLVEGEVFATARQRESINDLLRLEAIV